MDPLSPRTYLPPCPDCTPDDSDPEEYLCEDCEKPAVVCECCHIIIRACPCGHCTQGGYFVDGGTD